jgi:hypothetical protein
MNEVIQYVLDHQDQLSSIALGVIIVARMVASLTPSKRDDEVASSVEKGARRVIELISGAGHRNLIAPTQVDSAVPTQVATSDEDPFEALAQLVDRFGAKVIIVPKEK